MLHISERRDFRIAGLALRASFAELRASLIFADADPIIVYSAFAMAPMSSVSVIRSLRGQLQQHQSPFYRYIHVLYVLQGIAETW